MLMDKIKSLIKHVRWKIYYSTCDDKNKIANSHDFKTNMKTKTCPPQLPDLAPFEKDIFRISLPN